MTPAEPKPVLPGWRFLAPPALALTILAAISLYVIADRTNRHFAWTISPPLSAAFLGAGYAAGAALVALNLREKVWAHARVGYETVWVFVWLILAVTLVHRDRFHFDAEGLWPRFIAWLWLIVYIVVPIWMTVLLWAQRNTPGSEPPRVDPMPAGLAWAMRAQAAIFIAVGVGLLAAADRVLDAWPWTLTPLTARAIGSWCFALGIGAGLSVHERDLSRLRGPAVAYVVFGLLQAGALVRYGNHVDWDRGAVWLYVAMLALVTISGAYALIRSATPPFAGRRAE